MIALSAAIGVFSTMAHADVVDLKHFPASFCMPVLQVAEQTPECRSNGTFLRAARDCMDTLNKLEANLGAQAMAVAQSGVRNQAGENSTGHSEYGYSVDAFTYLIGMAELARAQVHEYKDYVVSPSLEYNPYPIEPPQDPLGWAYGVGCYRDAKALLGDAEKAFAEKLERYAARRSEARSHETKLAARGTNYGSLAAAAATGRDNAVAPVGIPAGLSDNNLSDITGLKKEKELPVPTP